MLGRETQPRSLWSDGCFQERVGDSYLFLCILRVSCKNESTGRSDLRHVFPAYKSISFPMSAKKALLLTAFPVQTAKQEHFLLMRIMLYPIHFSLWHLRMSKRNWTRFAKLYFPLFPIPLFKIVLDSRLFISQQHNASCPTAWFAARNWLGRSLQQGYCCMALSQAFTNRPYYWQCRHKQRHLMSTARVVVETSLRYTDVPVLYGFIPHGP